MPSAHEMAIAAVMAELEEYEKANAAIAAGLAHRTTRQGTGPSVVYSIRLDRGELAALERRAAALGIRPTVLARNLIRDGLTRRHAEC